jgi:hypothetical protein
VLLAASAEVAHRQQAANAAENCQLKNFAEAN